MEKDIRVTIPNPVFKGTLNVTAAWSSILRSLCEQYGCKATNIVVRKRTDEEMEAAKESA